MKHLTAITLTSLVMILATSTKAQHLADSMVIQGILSEEVSSWNKGDAPTYSKHFAENGTFTNIRGMFFTGHQQFFKRHLNIFKEMFPKTILKKNVIPFVFSTPIFPIIKP